MTRIISLALALAALATAGSCQAAEATFSWLPNSEPDLAGYRIHYGSSSDDLGQDVDVSLPETGEDGRVHATIQVPATLTWYGATAYDSKGNESALSNLVRYDPAPAPPGEVQVVTVTVKVVVQ